MHTNRDGKARADIAIEELFLQANRIRKQNMFFILGRKGPKQGLWAGADRDVGSVNMYGDYGAVGKRGYRGDVLKEARRI